MKIARSILRPVAVVAAASLIAVSTPIPAARAALVATEQAAAADTRAQRAKVTAFLAREDVRSQMRSLGVSPEEAEKRVASLSDAEVAEVAGKLDKMPAGQGGFGTVIGAAVLIFLVLLITDILGLTHVFSFTNKGSARAD